MSQYFPLTAAARPLSLKAIFRMSDDEAHETFAAIRFADNGGAAFCPRCQCTAIYTYAARRIWKCKACNHQFSVTSGTIFASRKLAIRDYLAATAIFVNAVKGISALQLGRDLDVQYKTAVVLAHKLRAAIVKEQSEAQLSGVVEVDGAYFGGHVKQENQKADRKDRRFASEQTGKRQSVVVARERGEAGKTLPFMVAKEADAVALIRQAVAVGSTVHADEASGWDRPHAYYDVMQPTPVHQEASGARRAPARGRGVGGGGTARAGTAPSHPPGRVGAGTGGRGRSRAGGGSAWAPSPLKAVLDRARAQGLLAPPG